MSTLKSIQFRLESDEDFPMFQRLAWEKADLSIRDVLTQGIHPFFDTPKENDRCPSLSEALFLRVNDSMVRIPALEEFGYCHDVNKTTSLYYYQGNKNRFSRMMEVIQQQVLFVDNLSYLQLLDIAKARLQDTWCNTVANTLTKRAYPGFQELRAFLKTIDKKVKLSGYDDLNKYDLGGLLSLGDFAGRETLLINEALTVRNFRRASFVDNITDAKGRLRLKPSIDHLTLTLVPQGADSLHVAWRVHREGDQWRFFPELETSAPRRERAKAFADEWRRDEGRLCFATGLDDVVSMVDLGIVTPSFPSLDYVMERKCGRATATLKGDEVLAYGIKALPTEKWTGEQLKGLLSVHGMSMTGNKTTLIKKVAKVAAAKYQDRKEQLDAYFGENQFIRITAKPKRVDGFPGLAENDPIDRMVFSMYALRHLRGNAILDVDHENNTYTVEQLAHAFLTESVVLSGAFLKVA
jgi:hypothetical protein